MISEPKCIVSVMIKVNTISERVKVSVTSQFQLQTYLAEYIFKLNVKVGIVGFIAFASECAWVWRS